MKPSDESQTDSSELSLAMKKGILIIAAVAILGIIAVTSRGHNSAFLKASNNSSSQVADIQASSSSNSNDTTIGVTPKNKTGLKDGIFTGAAEDTPYGIVQIATVISGGKITDVNFLQMPSDEGHSRVVTTQAEPLLKQSTLTYQNANVDFISGATSTVYGYRLSIQAALDQAKVG